MWLRRRTPRSERSERGRPSRRRVLATVLVGTVGVAVILALGAHALSSISRRGATSTGLGASKARPVVGVQSGSAGVVRSDAETPEMPFLVEGPPAPEPLDARAPSAFVGPLPPSGPHWKLGPLPPIANLTIPEVGGASAGPAVPLRIVPRNGGGGALPTLEGTGAGTLPARPERSAVTTAARPLTLKLALSDSENSLYGPGRWLRIRATAPAPCYLAVFHVDARRMVSLVFPKRFTLSYRPNGAYNLVVRQESPDSAQFVVAVASVYPLTAADALLALEAQRPASAAAAEGDVLRTLPAAWDMILAYLRERAEGEPTFKAWERHAWSVVGGTRAARETPN